MDTNDLAAGVTIEEASAVLHRSKPTVYKMIAAGELASAKHGARRVVLAESLARAADQLGRQAEAEALRLRVAAAALNRRAGVGTIDDPAAVADIAAIVAGSAADLREAS